MKLKHLLLAGTIWMAGCKVNTSQTYSHGSIETKLELKEAIETERKVYNEFKSISSNYIERIHDCNDMSNEFRDVLVNNGFKTDDIRMVFAKRKVDKTGHMWVELKRGNAWLAYDPAGKLYSVGREILTDDYNVEKHFPGDYIYREPRFHGINFLTSNAGYIYRNDRFIDGRWVRSRR